MFLITAVIAAGVLISAIFPVFYQMAGTFSFSRTCCPTFSLRTNIKIILDVANQSQYARVWIKNTGSERVALADIQRSNVICGDARNFNLLSLSQTGLSATGQWSYVLYDLNDNNFWDPGETLEIDAHTSTIQTADPVYFQFSLPNGNSISDQFMASPASLKR